VNSTPAAPDFRGQSVAIFLENSRRVEGAVCAGVADVEHDEGYAKVVECVHIDWHQPEGAIAILYREFRRAAQRCLANKWRRVRFDIQSLDVEVGIGLVGAAGPVFLAMSLSALREDIWRALFWREPCGCKAIRLRRRGALTRPSETPRASSIRWVTCEC
jgi:hypothetical protein